jgi:formylglycine-generating enzyme required for sulfatase activity
VQGDLLGQARAQLQEQADAPFKKGDRQSVLTKVLATNALARIESGQVVNRFWKAPYGEPEWVTIPEGEFWMGSEKGQDSEKPVHKLHLPEFRISRVPVTNAQYALFIKDSGAKAPENWRSGQVPAGMENHPVTEVSWYDAMGYCKWLGERIDQPVTLPSEAEWEKAARGDKDKREYPWGDEWVDLYCNSDELGLNETTPVGLFLNGASSYGVLDLSGNVYEWTRSELKDYPYQIEDGREDTKNKDAGPIFRGGSFGNGSRDVRCANRTYGPLGGFSDIGFRVVVSPNASLKL